jgi:hypothetical protein
MWSSETEDIDRAPPNSDTSRSPGGFSLHEATFQKLVLLGAALGGITAFLLLTRFYPPSLVRRKAGDWFHFRCAAERDRDDSPGSPLPGQFIVRVTVNDFCESNHCRLPPKSLRASPRTPMSASLVSPTKVLASPSRCSMPAFLRMRAIFETSRAARQALVKSWIARTRKL